MRLPARTTCQILSQDRIRSLTTSAPFSTPQPARPSTSNSTSILQTSDMASKSGKRKLRVLCLHGYTSNSQVSTFQFRRLVAAFPPQDYEFIFPDGPHKVTANEGMDPMWHQFVFALNENSERIGHRAWWSAKEADPKRKTDGEFEGIEETFEYLGKWLRERGCGGEDGGIDAIWGFSQGACLAGMLCALLSRQISASEEQHPLMSLMDLKQQPGQLKAGIIFSGFRARFPQYDTIYEPEGIDIPMLHVLGDNDPLVGSERSEALIRICGKGEVLRFNGGHEIPRKEEAVSSIVKFMRSNLEPGYGVRADEGSHRAYI